MDSALQHGPRPLPLFLQIIGEETGNDPVRMGEVLAAVRRYQSAPRGFVRADGPIAGSAGRAVLRLPRKYSDLPHNYRAKTVFIPSPINAPVVLDMDAGGSLLDWLDARGHAPLLLDWGRTTPSQRDENIDEYVTRYAVPLLQSCQEPVHLVGYCLGGVIAMAAACLTQVKSLTLIASPWNFSAYSAQRRAELAELWEGSKTMCAHMGVVPMELVQQGFWSLSRSRLVQKYLDLADMDMDSDAFRKFVAIEDWANGGEPLPYAMGKQLFEQFYALDRPGRNEWRIGDTLISPDTLACPAYEIASSTDEIVPLACSPALKNRDVLTQGHVGMVVGNSAPQRLWQSLDNWFASVDAD